MSHAYSVLAAFNMTDASNVVHRMLMIRNPWGSNGYSYTWSGTDANWTAALKAQVPFNFDPTSSNSNTGIFVMPVAGLMNAYCFEDIQFGHSRGGAGYANTWYDELNGPENTATSYTFTPTSNDGDIYFTVESYPQQFVPSECFTGTTASGGSSNYPMTLMSVYNGNSRISYVYYYEQYHRPILVTSSQYTAGSPLRAEVTYQWVGQPAHKDYTVTVYSKQNGV